LGYRHVFFFLGLSPVIQERGAMADLQQYLQSKGYNIIPTARLQKYITSIDLRSAVEDNVAFKLSFGLTFMLAGFAKF
jgi:hypothetical protein